MTTKRGHEHSEAYCLMKYRSDDGTEEEIIWNSRDGVTPFVLTLRSGKPARHVEWDRDVYDPDYVPKPGERIFLDLTPERAFELAKRNLQQWASNVDPGEWMPSVEELANGYLRPGAPDIQVVQ